ncbi:unnamed protein product [Oppiella nova]|uniref:WH1 domain-containing protein n=1 Tax=Oppiella nova TaxID=334625 RepID=A0A7R9LSM9_9ACAR|nr:unnamed protein product [Oppiella nova]CAG2166560.1 unnamed protein product [Oppiella nova]
MLTDLPETDRPANRPSTLLTPEANQTLFNLLSADDCLSLSTTAIEHWPQSGHTIPALLMACLVRHRTNGQHFIRVYDLTHNEVVCFVDLATPGLERDIRPMHMKFTAPGDEEPVRLNFINKVEAKHFEDMVFQTMADKEKQLMVYKRQFNQLAMGGDVEEPGGQGLEGTAHSEPKDDIQTENQWSPLLGAERRQTLSELLCEDRCRSLIAAIVKFKHRENAWAGRESVACVVVGADNYHAIHVYDISWGRSKCVYKRILTAQVVDEDSEFTYTVDTDEPVVHRIVGKYKSVILRFVDESEAKHFRALVVEIMERVAPKEPAVMVVEAPVDAEPPSRICFMGQHYRRQLSQSIDSVNIASDRQSVLTAPAPDLAVTVDLNDGQGSGNDTKISKGEVSGKRVPKKGKGMPC